MRTKVIGITAFIITALVFCGVMIAPTFAEPGAYQSDSAQEFYAIRSEYEALAGIHDLTSASRAALVDLQNRISAIPPENLMWLSEAEQNELETISTNLASKIESIDSFSNDIAMFLSLADDYSLENVCSDDKADLVYIQTEINKLLASNRLIDSERANLTAADTKLTSLLDKLTEVQAAVESATQSEAATEVSNVSSTNVQWSDRSNLESAEDTLLQALGVNESNLTESEASAISAQLFDISSALKVLNAVKNAERLFAQLPSLSSFTMNDESSILAARDAYESLSDYGKGLLDTNLLSRYNATLAVYYSLLNQAGFGLTGPQSIGAAILAIVVVSSLCFIIYVIRNRKRPLEDVD